MFICPGPWLLAANVHHGLGDVVTMNPVFFHQQPRRSADALSMGYVPTLDGKTPYVCTPGLGYPYALNGQPTEGHVITHYFTASGQISGYGLELFGKENAALGGLVTQGYYVKQSDGRYHLTVGFREGLQICNSSYVFKEPIGTSVIINPQTMALKLPLTAKQAVSEGYYRGACIASMGIHYVKGHITGKWGIGDMSPVVPMYHPATGRLRTIFLSTPSSETMPRIVPHDVNGWDPELAGDQMCWNFCEDTCPYNGTGHWHTSHIFFDGAFGNLAVACPATDSCLAMGEAGAPFSFPGGMGFKCCPSAGTEAAPSSSPMPLFFVAGMVLLTITSCAWTEIRKQSKIALM